MPPANCQHLKPFSTYSEYAISEIQKVSININPYLTNNSSITNLAFKPFIEACIMYAISAICSVTMGLEIPISRRKTVAEQKACAEHISILGILEISATNIAPDIEEICCNSLTPNQNPK